MNSKLLIANAEKYKSQQDIHVIENVLSELQKRQDSPITALELLSDNVIESAFPNTHYLLCLLVLVPHSEAVVERGFSKMKLIMTDKRTRLDPKSLETLMRISHHTKPLNNDDVNNIISLWKSNRQRRIFYEEI